MSLKLSSNCVINSNAENFHQNLYYKTKIDVTTLISKSVTFFGTVNL